MLPVTTAGSLEALDGGVGAGWSRYLRRIARRDTDLEHASWLIWLAVTKPSMLYKVTQMHKRTLRQVLHALIERCWFGSTRLPDAWVVGQSTRAAGRATTRG